MRLPWRVYSAALPYSYIYDCNREAGGDSGMYPSTGAAGRRVKQGAIRLDARQTRHYLRMWIPTLLAIAIPQLSLIVMSSKSTSTTSLISTGKPHKSGLLGLLSPSKSNQPKDQPQPDGAPENEWSDSKFAEMSTRNGWAAPTATRPTF